MRPRGDGTPVRLDDELLQQFREEPELLAIADAIQATHVRRKRRTPFTLVAVAAAVAAVAATAVVVTDVSEASVVDDARNAIVDAESLEIVTLQSLQNDFVVDLRSGAREPSRIETAAWLDAASGKVTVAERRNGELVDVHSDGSVLAARFAAAYRDALLRGSVTEVSEATRSFEIISGQLKARVVLGKDDLPRAFTPAGGRTIEIAQFSTGTAEPSPRLRDRSGAAVAAVISRTQTTVERSARETGLRVLAPAELAGLPRRAVTLERLAAQTRDGTFVGSGVTVRYSHGARDLAVHQARFPSPAYGFSRGLTAGGNPVPRAPKLDLRIENGVARGQFRLGAAFVTVAAAEPDLVTAAARDLATGRS